jgi:hypothetical protein
MPSDELFRRYPVSLGYVLEIDAELAAIDDRDAPEPPFPSDVRQVGRKVEQPCRESVKRQRCRIVMDEQRAVGRDGLDHAPKIAAHTSVERQHAGVHGRINIAAELDG